MNEDQAKKHIKELKGFYEHLAAYIGVNLMLVGINLFTGPGTLWFIFPMLGWGIGLICHAADVFWTGKDWEERKLEELTGLKSTQDELQRLSERTDALISILAGVDWARIDPEFLGSKEKLEQIRERLKQSEHGPNAQDGKAISREIEELEKFVTSPKFEFYDCAAGS